MPHSTASPSRPRRTTSADTITIPALTMGDAGDATTIRRGAAAPRPGPSCAAAPPPHRAVPVPSGLADLLCAPPHHDLAWLPAGARVLEPSAGDGVLVAAILRANPSVVVSAVEPDPGRAATCAARHPGPAGAVQMHVTTFEKYASTAIRRHVHFDAVVMRPPFMLPGQADVWFEHLRLAWQLLRPGGRLVAVVPDRFTHRSSGTAREARQYVERHGSHVPLPTGTVTTPPVPADVRVVRLSKPLHTGNIEHLLSADTSAPVRVHTPVLTAAAASTTPAQLWYSSEARSDRVLRYRGRCLLCRWLLWSFDDEDGDPAGILGNFSAGVSLDAGQNGLHGPTVGLCRACGADGDHYRTALAQARTHWARPAAAPAGF